MDALVMKNGNLYILCDSTKPDLNPESGIAAEFMSNFGDVSCSLEERPNSEENLPPNNE